MLMTIRKIGFSVAIIGSAAIGFGQYSGPLRTTSPVWNGVFFSGEMLPFWYSFQGGASISATQIGGGRFRIYSIDQLAWVNNANMFGNPCGMKVSISCDVLENGRVVRTIFPTRSGIYFLDPKHVYGGGINDTRFDVYQPTFRFKIVTFASKGTGFSQKTWSYKP